MDKSTYLHSQDRSPHTVATYSRDVAAFFAWLPEQLGKPVALVAVTPLGKAKADLVTVAELLGHSSVATTAIYTQPSESELADAVTRLR